MKSLIALAAAIALVAALVSGPCVQAKDSRWAYVENQTSDTVTLAYEETREGYRAKSRTPVYPGQVIRLDAATIEGEICAWRAYLAKPAEKVACRTLNPGDRWVIY